MQKVLDETQERTTKEGIRMERIVIGICGGTGSGKTTLAKKINDRFKDKAVLISMDCYYKDHMELPYEERAKINYDHPNAFDTDLLIRDIKKLKNGESIDHPTYDFSNHRRSSEVEHAEPKEIILVEGILLFENRELVDLFDVKLYVDTDADVRIIRRILRDVEDRGRNLDSVVEQYLKTVKPMHERFVEPSKRVADIIIPEGGYNRVALDMIIGTIKKKLEDKE